MNKDFDRAVDECDQAAGPGDAGWNRRYRAAVAAHPRLSMVEGKEDRPQDIAMWMMAPLAVPGQDDGWPDETFLVWRPE